MKKQLLLILATMLSIVVASAQLVPAPQIVKNCLINKNGKTELTAALKGHNVAVSSAAQKATADVPPGGVVVECIRSTKGQILEIWTETVEPAEQSGLIGRYSLQDDGSIYIYSPVAICPTDTWAKAEKQADGTYLVKGGFLYQEEYDGEMYDYTINKMVYDDANGTYVVAENQDIKYVLDENGVLSMVPEENTVVGIIDVETGMWTGYGSETDVLAPLTETPVVVPDGLTFIEYAFISGDDLSFGKVAFDGNDVYVGGIPGIDENLYIKGTIADNKVTVPANQLMGPDEDYGYYFYFCGVDTTYIYDPVDDWNYLDMVLNNKDVVFDYDPETKSMKTDDCFAINAGTEKVQCAGYYFGCSLETWVELPATPQAPIIITVDPYEEAYGQGYMEFEIPMTGTNGEQLIEEKLFFKFYLDGEVYEHDQDEYYGNAGSGIITEFPMTYSDITIFGFDGYFYFYYPFTGFETLSIQSIYLGGGERRESELSNYTTGVKSINTAKEIVSEVYTDLSGRRVTEPKLGLFIRTVTYTDGSQENFKVVKRTF